MREVAVSQVKRLANTIGFRDLTDEAITDLIDEVARCSNKEDAKALMDEWLGESKFCPTIHDLRHKRLSMLKANIGARAGCEVCGYTGYRLVSVLVHGGRVVSEIPEAEREATLAGLRSKRMSGYSVSTASKRCACVKAAAA